MEETDLVPKRAKTPPPFPKRSRPSLGSTQPPIQGVRGSFSGVKRRVREAYLHLAPRSRMRGDVRLLPHIHVHGVHRNNSALSLPPPRPGILLLKN
jgi:hypothetical protein